MHRYKQYRVLRPHRQFPQLSGREDLILKLVTEKYQEIVDRHQHRVVDGRAETHLQVMRQDSAATVATCAPVTWSITASRFPGFNPGQRVNLLQVAALLLATYRTLLPWLRDDKVNLTPPAPRVHDLRLHMVMPAHNRQHFTGCRSWCRCSKSTWVGRPVLV